MNLVEDYAIASTCGVLALPRSSYYYQASQQEEQQAELQAALLRLAAQWPTYGYRRLTAHLHREGWRVNSKRVRELMAQLGLTKHVKPRKVRTTNSQHSFWRYPNLVQVVNDLPSEQVLTGIGLALALNVEQHSDRLSEKAPERRVVTHRFCKFREALRHNW